MFMRMMPKKPAPGVGSKQHFSLPWFADPQAMARFHDARERIHLMGAPHIEGITFNTRTLKNGYPEDMEEFEEDFTHGVIQAKRLMLDRNMIRNINRTIEYTLCRYVYGDPVVMASFSTQTIERLGYANVRTGTFRGAADAHLNGQNWGMAAANIFSDLNYLKGFVEIVLIPLAEKLIYLKKKLRKYRITNKDLFVGSTATKELFGCFGGSIQTFLLERL